MLSFLEPLEIILPILVVLITNISVLLPPPVVSLETHKTLLITEVYYDTPGSDIDEEWIELLNISGRQLDLSGYKIGDEEIRGEGEGMMRFPDDALINDRETIIIAQSSSGFEALFGQLPDYEIHDLNPSVPNLVPHHWSGGKIRLANDGDEILILDESNSVVDVVAYGNSGYFEINEFTGPPVRGVERGQSIERNPADCDTNSSVDWQPNRMPNPWIVSSDGSCRSAISTSSSNFLPMGQVQGEANVSPLINQRVSLRGIVTGVLENQNQQGDIFYSVFLQDLLGEDDSNPSTSDGLTIFTGLHKPQMTPGDIVAVSGVVTEYYGLTEIDDNGLSMTILSRGNPLPEPIQINLQAEPGERANYLEMYESMLVSFPPATVVGPTHKGCGFEVVSIDSGTTSIHRSVNGDQVGLIAHVLHPSNIECTDMPSVNSGDVISGLVGPLTFHFDEFKIVYQDPSSLSKIALDPAVGNPIPRTSSNQFSVVTFNLDDYLEGTTSAPEHPELLRQDIDRRQTKISYALSQLLHCPTIVGVQEVGSDQLLIDLSMMLEEECGYLYRVSHIESPDSRGIDVALMIDPRRVLVHEMRTEQSCTETITEVVDPDIECPQDSFPLYSRPPLSARISIDGELAHIFVNHFKSKRGGEFETASIRQAQSAHLAGLVRAISEEAAGIPMIVTGDFNDYADSPSMEILTGEAMLADALHRVPTSNRYSYIFGGVRQLVDWILVSPDLDSRILFADVLHINADYSLEYRLDVTPTGTPFRSSDHDVPFVIFTSAETDSEQGPIRAISGDSDTSWGQGDLSGGSGMGWLEDYRTDLKYLLWRCFEMALSLLKMMVNAG